MTERKLSRVRLVSSILLLILSGCAKQKTASAPSPPIVSASAASGIQPIEARVPAISPAIHVGPASLYPDPNKTPGDAATLSVADLTASYTDHCPSKKTSCTYSQSHRNVPASLHKKVYDSYSVPQDKRNIQSGEVDHFYPMCAGGSNDEKNLWYQPADTTWKGKTFGYHQKDQLGSYICQQIKDGELDPKTAYKKITGDWVAYYLELQLGSKSEGPDADTD